jgi:flagellar biosynthesis anti-sigma factor FlgM
MDKVLETPAARAKKIKEIKRKIEEGTYKIDSKKVAEKMVRDGVVEELLRPI